MGKKGSEKGNNYLILNKQIKLRRKENKGNPKYKEKVI